MSKQILVLGSINVDHILQVDHLPQPGQTLAGQSYNIMAGGKGANQAVACARLGGNTHIMAAIGEDEFGREIVCQLNDEGIETSAVIEAQGHNTGVALIFVDAKGENSIGISAGANDALTADDVVRHAQLIANADYLLLQQEVCDAVILQAIHSAKKYALKVVLNPAPARPLPDEVLRSVDVITPNQSEAEILTGVKVTDGKSAQYAASLLHDKGIMNVVITMGPLGAYASSGVSGRQQGELIAGFPVKAVDTTAAGDTFNGALLVALAEGKSLHEAVFFANASAGLSVMSDGSQSSIPYRFEVEQFIQCDHEIAEAAQSGD